MRFYKIIKFIIKALLQPCFCDASIHFETAYKTWKPSPAPAIATNIGMVIAKDKKVNSLIQEKPLHLEVLTESNLEPQPAQVRKLSDQELQNLLNSDSYEVVYRSPKHFDHPQLDHLDPNDFDSKGFKKSIK